MATFVKSRGRAPLAEGSPAISSGVAFSGEKEYSIAAQSAIITDAGRALFYRVNLSRAETFRFMGFVAGSETVAPADRWRDDKRTLSEKLRALADKLDAG